jgi:hypothetical protein
MWMKLMFLPCKNPGVVFGTKGQKKVGAAISGSGERKLLLFVLLLPLGFVSYRF